MVCSY